MMSDEVKNLLFASYNKDKCNSFLDLLGKYNQSFSSFDRHYERLFKFRLLYEAYKSGLFERFVSEEFPLVKFDLPKDLSFQDFIVHVNDAVSEQDNVFLEDKTSGTQFNIKISFFEHLTERFLTKYCDNNDIISVEYSTINNAKRKTCDYTLYLPVDFKSLHKFATAFLSTTSANGLEYAFGIDKYDGLNNCATMWVSASEEDLEYMIYALEYAKDSCKDIKFNQRLLLGTSYNDHIVVTKEKLGARECYIDEIGEAIRYYAADRPNYGMFLATTKMVLESDNVKTSDKCEEIHKKLGDFPLK